MERFVQSTWEEIQTKFPPYTESLSAPIDSFLESHILKSEHFIIMIDDKPIGYFSIFEQQLLTRFYLEKAYRSMGQHFFFRVRRMQKVSQAFVPTCDEFFMAHALDDYRLLEKQAYFFQDSEAPVTEEKVNKTMKLRLANSMDIPQIVRLSGDFFDAPGESVSKKEIFIAESDGQIAAFGIIEKGKILTRYASIGMFTVDTMRQQGFGSNVLLRLKDIVRKRNQIPIAGCWYYNHFSKKTLESAGMYSATRLLKVYY